MGELGRTERAIVRTTPAKRRGREPPGFRRLRTFSGSGRELGVEQATAAVGLGPRRRWGSLAVRSGRSCGRRRPSGGGASPRGSGACGRSLGQDVSWAWSKRRLRWGWGPAADGGAWPYGAGDRADDAGQAAGARAPGVPALADVLWVRT